jgi:hypothetical protein
MDEREQIVLITLLAAAFVGLIGGWIGALLVCPPCNEPEPKPKRKKGAKP